MRQLQDDVIDNTLFSIEDIPSTAGQADAVFASPVSGINDSTYNAFPATPSYMQGGFAPSYPVYEEPIDVIAPEPIYAAPTPIDTPRLGKCMRVIFSANRGFSANAYWTDCSGVPRSRFVSVNESLEVDALDGTASGLPFMSYPIGGGSALYEPVPEPTPLPPAPPVLSPEPTPLPPAPPVFATPEETPLPPAPPSLLKKCYSFSLTNVSNGRYDVGYTDCCNGEIVNFSLQAGETRDNLQYETTNFNTSDLVASNIVEGCRNVGNTPQPSPTPVDAIKTGVMPPDDMEQMPVRQMPDVVVNDFPISQAPVSQTITPETPTLPTKAVSKDLKPYIIAGIAVVGILIAARLLSKK